MRAGRCEVQENVTTRHHLRRAMAAGAAGLRTPGARQHLPPSHGDWR